MALNRGRPTAIFVLAMSLAACSAPQSPGATPSATAVSLPVPTSTQPTTTAAATTAPLPSSSPHDLASCRQLDCEITISRGTVVPVQGPYGLDEYRVLSIDDANQVLHLGLLRPDGHTVGATSDLEPGQSLPVGKSYILQLISIDGGHADLQVCAPSTSAYQTYSCA